MRAYDEVEVMEPDCSREEAHYIHGQRRGCVTALFVRGKSQQLRFQMFQGWKAGVGRHSHRPLQWGHGSARVRWGDQSGSQVRVLRGCVFCACLWATRRLATVLHILEHA